MAKIISFSVDLSKIDKTKIKQINKKDGTLGQFLDVSVVLNDTKDKFGNDASMSIGQTKEEKDQKVNRVFLGNGKIVWDSTPIANLEVPDSSNSSNSLPF